MVPCLNCTNNAKARVQNADFNKYQYFFMEVHLGIEVWAFLGSLLVAILIFMRKNSRTQKLLVELVDRKHVDHNTLLLTFVLPNQKKNLALLPGQHLEIEHKINGDIVRRKYTPISDLQRIGSFQLIVRVFHPCETHPNGGKMSSALKDIPLRTKLKVTYPYGRVIYEGKKCFRIIDSQGRAQRRKYRQVYMLAAGTGITSMFQLIRYFCEKEESLSLPKTTLLYCNKSDMNILLEKELRAYMVTHPKFTCHFSVNKPISREWSEMVGQLDLPKIKQTLKDEVRETLFLFAGSLKLYQAFCEILEESLGVEHSQIHKF